jgi:multidrug efflux pump subunit AcrA (membrane-fusion protein)
MASPRAALSDGGFRMLEERQGAGRDILDLPETLYEADEQDADFDIGPRQSWFRRRWPFLLGVLLIVILLAAFILPKVLKPKATPITYTTALVRQGTLAVTVSATGPVTAPTYDANFAEQGTIYSIHVKVGQHVNAGDVLGKITATDGIIYELDAPHAGTVAVINGNVDGTPGSGSGSGTSAFVELVDLSQLHVEADVNEVDIGSVKPGQQVTFTVSAYSTRVFRGTVATISPAGTSSSNVVTYPVTVNVNSSSLNGAQLLPSMTANVTITTASVQNALLVPASAVTFARSSTVVSAEQRRQGLLQAAQMAGISFGGTTRGTTGSTTGSTTAQRTPGIVLEQVQGKWVVKPVVLGLTNGTNYVVLSGLTQGETVVTGQSGGSSSSTTTNGTGAGGFGPGGGQFIVPGGGGRGGNGGGNGGGNNQSFGR